MFKKLSRKRVLIPIVSVLILLAALFPGACEDSSTPGSYINQLTVNDLTSDIGRTVTYSVAASDAPAHVIAQADYVCDGTADEVQIQAAIDALPAIGGSVQLSQGTFTCAAQIDMASAVELVGSNQFDQRLTTSGTTLSFAASAIDGIVLASGVHGVRLEKLRIVGHGTGDATYGIKCEEGNDMCVFMDIRCFYFGVGILCTHVDSLTLERFSCSGNGIGLQTAGAVSQIYANDCFFDVCTTYGMDLAAPCRGGVHNSEFTINGTAGFYTDVAHNGSFVLENCLFQSNGTYGAFVDSGSGNIMMINCEFADIDDSGDIAIRLKGSNCNVISNVIRNCDKAILIAGTGHKILYNYIKDITDYGIYTGQPALIQGNRFTNCGTIIHNHDIEKLTIRDNFGFIGPGEIKTISQSITAGVQNTVTSIQNPEAQDCVILEAYVSLTAAATATNPTYDMGTDDDGTGAPSDGNNLFDAIPDTVGYYRSTNGAGSGTQIEPVVWNAAGGASDYVNFIIVDAAGADTAGEIYIQYMGLG